MSTKTFADGMKDGRNNEKMASSDPDYIKGYEAGKKEYFKDQSKEEELRKQRKENGTTANKVKISLGFDGIRVDKTEDPTGNGGLEISPSESVKTVRKIILIVIILIFVSSLIAFFFNFIRMKTLMNR